MDNRIKQVLLENITNFYLYSSDFNGIPTHQLVSESGFSEQDIKVVLRELIQDELVGVVYSDVAINPHVLRLGFESPENQIAKLATEAVTQSCVYPRKKHLTEVVDRSQYADIPFTLEMALGEPQLSHRSFDLSVLEFYRNDPRYLYDNNDVSGHIYARGEYSDDAVEAMSESDQVFLQSFGFSYDDELNRAVAVYLRYLSDLSSEHQRIWKAKALSGNYRLHPDYYRNTIIGDWGERVPIFDAFLSELRLLNQMADAMGREPLFRNDFGEYGENKPKEFGFLIRPTLKEFNDFVLLLDKMLSDNISKKFFGDDVEFTSEHERKDGKIEVRNKGSLQILDEWIRKFYSTDDWEPWEHSIATFRKVRRLRQKPAHAIKDNEFNQKYLHEQRKLIIDAFDGIRNLRMMLENHPKVKTSDIVVPKWLREGLVWHY